MQTVSVSELKAQLSKYLRVVRRGGEVQILDRGIPVARLSGISPGPPHDVGRQRLVASGLLRLGRGDISAVLDEPPVSLPISVGDALEEDRADRM